MRRSLEFLQRLLQIAVLAQCLAALFATLVGIPTTSVGERPALELGGADVDLLVGLSSSLSWWSASLNFVISTLLSGFSIFAATFLPVKSAAFAIRRRALASSGRSKTAASWSAALSSPGSTFSSASRTDAAHRRANARALTRCGGKWWARQGLNL